MRKYVDDYTIEGFVKYLKTRAKVGPFIAFQHRRGRGSLFTKTASKYYVEGFKKKVSAMYKDRRIDDLYFVEYDGRGWLVSGGVDTEALYDAVAQK